MFVVTTDSESGSVSGVRMKPESAGVRSRSRRGRASRPAVTAHPALEGGVEDAAGEQRPLDRVGGLAGAEEVLDPQHQRVEEAGAGRRGQVHQGRDDRVAAGGVVDPGGDRGVVDVAVQDQDRRAEAVDVFDHEGDRDRGPW